MDERVSWEYMTENYPNMWIAIRDSEMDGPDVVSGIIVAALTDDEIIDYENAHDNEGLRFRRTKNGASNGPIRANFVIETA